MARPLSEAKRNALLAATTELVATTGMSATTAKIAKQAGLSEGTLFTYFANKDELLNALYTEIEAELAEALMVNYPKGASSRDCVLHAWNRFIDWGAAHPARRLALKQLKVSDRISTECRATSDSAFSEIKEELHRSLEPHVPPGQAIAYLYAVFNGLAEATLEFIASHPEQAEQYKQTGFNILWNGITSP